MRTKTHRFACLFAVLALFFAALFPLSAQSGASDSEAPKWTETDSRLANHYLRLLQQKPEYGNVLDLLWDLYEKKNQTPLLMDYLAKATKAKNAYIPKLIYAHLLRKQGSTDEARSFYDEVVKGLPDNIPALKALAEISEQQNRDSKALSYYTRLVKLIPASQDDGVAIRFRKAAMHQTRGQTKAAVALWNELLKARADDPKVRSEVVSLLLEVGETSVALDVLEKQAEASGAVKSRLAALEELTRVYELIHDFEGADRAAQSAMAVLHFKNHQHHSFFERWVKLHERFDRLSELETRLKNNVEEENPSEASLYRLAAFYQLTADYKNEEATLEKLVERLPKSIDYRVRLAELQLANDRYADSAATLDEILKKEDSIPYHLMLLRVKVDLNAEEELAAEQRLYDYLKANPGDSDLRDKIVEFARSNYLDQLVEKLLRESVDSVVTGSDGDSAPLDLARFLHERGRRAQAGEVINNYIESSEKSTTERSRKLHYAAMAFRDLGMNAESEAAIDEALTIQPDNVEFLTTKSGLQIDRRDSEAAIKTLERIFELHTDLDDQIDVDKKIFNLLRANVESGIAEVKPVQTPKGPPRSVTELRKIAAALSSSRRDADNETPKVLIKYFERLKDNANRLRTVEARYRAAWWAFKLQDNHEVYFQLEAAKRDAGKDEPESLVAVEEMLLELAIQNDRPENVVRHLEVLCKLDPENYEEHRHRWAEAKFHLGSEDVAVRELQKLASKPDASLQTLSTLAKVYGMQGNRKKQVAVWKNAYRKANLFDKRRIVRQLTAALLDQKEPQAALKAQMDLVIRETDELQRRKQFESQMTVATRNFLLTWLKDRYLEAVQKEPFDRFFPEALGRIHLAMGNHQQAFDSLKKAYYMSGQNDDLLDELGDLASKLGDLNSAIYYSRQMISRGEGEANIDNWENLIRMLERDFRSSEADLVRSRLEIKFGQDPDFLERLAMFYYKNLRFEDAHRVFRKRARLREWDVKAQFDLALIKREMGNIDEALPVFESVIELTDREPQPNWADKGLWPLIESSDDPAHALEAFNVEIQIFPMIPSSIEEEFSSWSEARTHPEFEKRPSDKYAIRLRTLEELAKYYRDLPNRETIVGDWLTLEIPSHEKLWIARHADSATGLEALAYSAYFDDLSSLTSYSLAQGHIDAGDPGDLAVFAASLEVRNPGGKDADKMMTFLCEQELSAPVVNHIFTGLKNDGLFQEALQFGESKTDDPNIAFLVAQLADWMSDNRKQAELLDEFIKKRTALEFGGAFPALNQIAIAERYRICDSADERTDLMNSVRRRAADNPLYSPLTGYQIDALFGGLSGDYESAFSALEGVAKQLQKLRPREYGNEIRYSEAHFGWERVKKELRFYTELFPRKPRQSDEFARAFGGEPFSRFESGDSWRVYEFFEGYRLVNWLNGKSATDRSILIERALPDFQSLDGRLDFARDLEKYGYLREATDVYYREVINGTEDYAPVRGLFKNATAIMYPEPALDVLQKLNSGEISTPPGLTTGYIREQHAKLLWYSRNIELLSRLAQPPESREGEPPVKTSSHLPYQDQLINAYLYTGESDALLHLLSNRKKRNESTGRDLLLGADLLIKNGSLDEALNWLDQITYSSKETKTELAALDRYFQIYQTRDHTTKKELKWLSRIALQYQSVDICRKLAELFQNRNDAEEAISLLRILHRNEKKPAVRNEIQLLILDIVIESMKDDPESLADELSVGLAGLNNHFESDINFVEWVVAKRDKLAAQMPVFESFETSATAGLLAAYLNEELPTAVASLKETSTRDDFEAALFIVSILGDEGRTIAASEVTAARRAGPTWFAGRPERQIQFFSQIGDSTRLVEVHAALMRMADSYFFFGRSTLSAYPTLQRHWQIPGLMARLGHKNRAATLYAKFFSNIRYHRSDEIPFVEAYVDFLIEEERFEAAERVLLDITKHSPGFDLRKILKLYHQWDRLDSIGEKLPQFELTTGQLALVNDWREALVEGRELVEYNE